TAPSRVVEGRLAECGPRAPSRATAAPRTHGLGRRSAPHSAQPARCPALATLFARG
nr:hypothetical protein [Tanacetum cinerariifolium]